MEPKQLQSPPDFSLFYCESLEVFHFQSFYINMSSFFKALHQKHNELGEIERRLLRDWDSVNEQKLKIQSQQDDIKRRIDEVSESRHATLMSLFAEFIRVKDAMTQ